MPPQTPPTTMRVNIIGAGVSGILMAYKLRKHLPDVEIRILEKNSDLGGTWFENRYPGCACDVPSHIYQYSFAPNPYWSEHFSGSGEIQKYLKGVSKQFDLEKYITYNSKVTSARWDENRSVWDLQVEGQGTLTSEILINAGGILNNPQIPVLKNLASFKGPMLHTAAWDNTVDLRQKRVAIIGAGASAIQLLPQLQKVCSRIDTYIRTPSWICEPVGLPAGHDSKDLNPKYSQQDMDRYREDPAYYLETRKWLETQFNNMYGAMFKGSKEQQDIRNRFEGRMKQLIQSKALQDKLIPSFEVGCRRINPGEGYLVALQESNVQPVFDPIDEITTSGIVAADNHREVDAIVLATGFDTSFRPRFPIVGRNSVDLQELWSSTPVSFMGTGVSGFPNYMIFLGPNTPISNGSLMGPLEATSDYFLRIISKMLHQRIRSFDVRQDAQTDFDEHIQSYMKNMVWSGTCRSWFKRSSDQRVTALWPGSSLHYIETLAENRWENYKWDMNGNRFLYWDKGFSATEIMARGLEKGTGNGDDITTSEIPDFAHYLLPAPPLPQEAVRKT